MVTPPPALCLGGSGVGGVTTPKYTPHPRWPTPLGTASSHQRALAEFTFSGMFMVETACITFGLLLLGSELCESQTDLAVKFSEQISHSGMPGSSLPD
ncbi:hypothetical protein Tco_0311983 [Tanacetum coccineum]